MLPPCVTKRNCALNFWHAFLVLFTLPSLCTVVYQYAVKVGGVDHITDSFNSFYKFAKVSCHLFSLDDFGITRKRRWEKPLVHQGLEAHHNGVICKNTSLHVTASFYNEMPQECVRCAWAAKLGDTRVRYEPPFVVSFCDWMPCWILEWMVGKRSAAWATSFWASATELVWFYKMYRQKQKNTSHQHIKPFKTQKLREDLCFTSFLVKVISAVSRSRVNLILLKSAKHCWCCEIKIWKLYSVCTFKTSVVLLMYLKLRITAGAFYRTHLQLDLGVSLLTLSAPCALCQRRTTRQIKAPLQTVFHFHLKKKRTGLKQIP